MGYGIGKKDNEYARQIIRIDAPKTVFMAIAYSFAVQIYGEEKAPAMVLAEWATLHQNGIVPQKPKKR